MYAAAKDGQLRAYITYFIFAQVLPVLSVVWLFQTAYGVGSKESVLEIFKRSAEVCTILC